ncbi:TPA: beta family protein [Stenotrophomonas maltophilia]|uniref:beta family protein n=1 Tax=Stenotrophomonas sp. FR024 TaxID=3398460 RepID=UPI0013105B0F|nr:beta family protein [Stenotrophomonas maltophilia]
MNEVAGKRYVPILRSRDAEIRAYAELSGSVKDALLPVVEYTKSRRTKKNTEGSVSVCVSKIEEHLAGRSYIADVTTMDSLSNAETAMLLDADNGFRNWRAFVLSSLNSACIPTVHLTDPFDERSVLVQCKAFLNRSTHIAFRIPVDYDSTSRLVDVLKRELGGLEQVILICDGGYVSKSTYAAALADSKQTLVAAGAGFALRAVACSSFPKSVVLPDYGGDEYGKFELLEVKLSEDVRAEHGLGDVVHGDYALVHPEDFKGIVTSWVPRVDVPLDQTLFYHRYRRPNGGYDLAADKAFHDPDYVALDCWGHENIKSAAGGAVQGRSPAHWISVRINFHLSRQSNRIELAYLLR